MKKQTWISDIQEGLKELNKDYSLYHNDVTKNQRRIKFYATKNNALRVDELFVLQQFIQNRRPELNVTVKDWTNSPTSGPFSFVGPTYCVYYKPKVQVCTR